MKHILILLALVFSMTSVNAQTTSAETQSTSPEQDYQSGLDYYVDGDYTQAYDEFEKLAAQGDARAQFYLGVLYENGQGVDQNSEQAFSLFEKAAKQGHPAAQHYLGLMYFFGHQGVDENRVEAQKWFILSTWKGNNFFAQGFRDILDDQLSVYEILKANDKAVECRDTDYQNCDVID